MSQKFLDIVVAKAYSTTQNGKIEQKTAWNRIGRAWLSRSGDALNFELFMLPNQRYVIQFKTRPQEQEQPVSNLESVNF